MSPPDPVQYRFPLSRIAEPGAYAIPTNLHDLPEPLRALFYNFQLVKHKEAARAQYRYVPRFPFRQPLVLWDFVDPFTGFWALTKAVSYVVCSRQRANDSLSVDASTQTDSFKTDPEPCSIDSEATAIEEPRLGPHELAHVQKNPSQGSFDSARVYDFQEEKPCDIVHLATRLDSITDTQTPLKALKPDLGAPQSSVTEDDGYFSANEHSSIDRTDARKNKLPLESRTRSSVLSSSPSKAATSSEDEHAGLNFSKRYLAARKRKREDQIASQDPTKSPPKRLLATACYERNSKRPRLDERFSIEEIYWSECVEFQKYNNGIPVDSPIQGRCWIVKKKDSVGRVIAKKWIGGELILDDHMTFDKNYRLPRDNKYNVLCTIGTDLFKDDVPIWSLKLDTKRMARDMHNTLRKYQEPPLPTEDTSVSKL